MLLGRMHLTLKRSAQQETALQDLLRSQQDSHSSQYHQWLTPDEFGVQFGPAQADIDKITAWLQSKGIKVTGISKGRTSIEFSATHAQIQNAFHTQLHWFNTKAGRQYSNVSNPKIPASLSPVVVGVGSLTSVSSRPMSHVVRQISDKGGLSGNPPSYLSGSSNYLAPGDFWTIYNATPAENSGITGKGVTIGIAGRSDVNASDVLTFRSTYLGNSYSGTYQQIVNGIDPGTVLNDDVENALDVEWASALAPDASVILVVSQSGADDGVYLSSQYLIDNNLADVVSVSYGECESFLQTSGVLQYSSLWEQAAAQGITVVVAAGDNGSAGCDPDTDSAAEFGMQVNGLASSPYNVAVGGTEFVDQGDSWAGSVSSTPLPGTSAQGYIPEEVWNESQQYSTLYAGSGGASSCYFSLPEGFYDTASCSGGWPKPDWQTGVTGIPADGVRDLPDVSFTAAIHDGYLIMLQGGTLVVGGTSAATPSFAGVMALVNQKAGGRQGMPNYQLYTLAGQEYGPAGAENQTNLESCNASLTQNPVNSCTFYDVTSGSNAVACVGGTENCSSTSANTLGVLTSYATGTGYDLATGLGSINITNLVNGWDVPAKGNSPSTTTLQISPTAGTHGSPLSVIVTVVPSSGSGSPTGSVSLLASGVAVATVQLSNGSWSGGVASLPGGNYPVTAQYSGDSSFASSTSSPVNINVSPEPSITTISVSARDAQQANPLAITSIPYGSNLLLSATIRGQSGIGVPVANSGISFTIAPGGTDYMGNLGPAGYSNLTITTVTPGVYTAFAYFYGDTNFASSTSAASTTFTVVPANTVVTLSAGVPSSGYTPITALVSADSFGNAPTGTVAFLVNGTQAGTATVQASGASPLHWGASTFNLPMALLNAGANAITAHYLGDGNYASSTISAPISITPSTITLTSPNPPAAPSLASEFKPGAQISVTAVIPGTFQNLQVQWAPGINPTTGWSSSGVTLSGNLSGPVLNVPVATWDTTSISAAGYYTVSVSVTNSSVTTTATTYVYLEPSLLSQNWPVWMPDLWYPHDAIVPALDSLGNTEFLLGGFEYGQGGSQLLSFSPDANTHTTYPLPQDGSIGLPVASNLHFSSGDDLIDIDGNSVLVFRPDGAEDIISPSIPSKGQYYGLFYSQLLVDDVDGDSLPEIVTVGFGEGGGSLPSNTAYLFAWRNTGQLMNSNFPVMVADKNSQLYSYSLPRVLVGDIDGDGNKEFVVLEGTSASTFTPRLFAADGTPKQWNSPTLQKYSNQMALADLDHNGKLETVIDCADGYLHVLNPDGAERPGWPQYMGSQWPGDSIAIGDMNQDGNEEIVVAHGGQLSVFKTDGTVFWPNWVNPYGGFDQAVIAEVNGDGYPEIVASFGYQVSNSTYPTYDVMQVLVIDRSGKIIRTWTLSGMNGQQIDWATVAVGNFLNDGKSEIAVGSQVTGLNNAPPLQMGAEVLSTGWNYNAAASDWPMLHRNSQQTAVLRRVALSTASLSSSEDPSNGSSPATFTVTVVASSGGSDAPAGKVNLIDGDQNIGSCVLSSGSCFITPALTTGTHSLTAGYIGDKNFDVSYSTTITQTVNGQGQTITFANPGAQAVGTPLALTASSTSGLTVGFASTTPSVCTVSGATAAFIASGTCTIDATQAGNSTYAAAPMIAQSFNVNGQGQTITFANPGAQAVGTPLALTASSTSGLTVGFASTTPSVCTVSGTTAAFIASGTCTIDATQAGNSTYAPAPMIAQSFNVNGQGQTITFANPGAQAVGTPLALTASSTSGLTVGFASTTPSVCTVSGTTAAFIASGTCTIDATQAGNSTYAPAPMIAQSFNVNGHAQTITFANPGAQTVGTPLALTASSTSGLTVGFASTTPSVCTVSGTTATFIASGTCTIDATQAGNSTYAAAPMIAQGFTVNSVILSLNFNVSELSFGSEPLNTTSPAQTVILANPNAAAVAITSIDASGDFTANSNCPIIAAYSTCTVGVTFTPGATGARTGILTVTSSGISPQSIPLSGTGTTASIQVAPAAINFGSQAIGATSPGQTVIIQNTGNATLSVSNIAATGDFATSEICSTVPAGSSCSLTVMFTPTAVGIRTGTLTLTDNAGGTGTSHAVSLVGVGTAAGASLSPSLLTFPATLVGATSFQINATLTNTGAADLTGISVLVQGDFTQANNCSATLAPNATCTISVKYVPSITGAETGSITVTDSLGSQNLPLAGSGIAPGVSLSTSELEFGGQLVTTTSQAQTAIVTNSGPAPLMIDSVQSSDNFSDTTNCSGTIPPGSSCSINIFFAPTAIGSLVGTVTVADSVGNQTINLQGLGNGAGLTIMPSFAIFGAQPVNSSSQAQTLTAKNTGTTPLTLNPITVTGNFTESDDCPSQLQAGSSCTVSVTFSPSATGSLSGSVNISDTSGAATTMATVSGQGTLPGIAAAPATLFFGSLPVGTTSQAQTITVTNTGLAPLQIGSVSGDGDFAETDTCADQTIAAGSLCLISVTMTPTTTGMRTGSIQIIDSADGSHIIALSGMGQSTGVSVSPTSLAFGSAPVSGSAQGTSLQVAVTNTGTSPLTFSGASTRGDFTESDSCGTTIAVGASCLLSINFVPTGLGHRTGSLTISDDAGGGVQLVSLEGDGSPVGFILTPPVLTFATPKQGVTSAPQTVVLSNNTGASLDNVAIAASGEYAERDNCGTTLLNGANCTVSITVTPVISGAITGTVTISSGGQISISSGAVRLRSSVTAASVSAAGTMSSSAVGVVALSTGMTAATPTFSVQPGNYNAAQTVTISDATPGATIYYAINANPTTSSMVYNGAIPVSSSETIEAIAVASGYAQSAVTTAAYTITLPTPAVTVTAASSSITTEQPLQVTVAVAGTPTPTGTVTLTSGPYSSSATPLSKGSATIIIPAGSLVTGEDTLTAAYTPDATSSSTYNSATGTALVTVTVPPSFTLSASPTSMSVAQGASGTSTISVTDIGAFSGIVALAATGLPSGVTASFAAGTAAGTQALTLTATNTAAVAGPVTITITGTSAELTASTTIALTITAEAAFTASGASGSDAPISIAPGATTGNTSTISVKGTNGFSGTVNLACSISPAAASAPATCTLSPSSVTLGGNTAQTATLTVNSSAATSATNRGERLFWPAGGTALALLLFFTVPRRRNWMAMLGLLVLLFSVGLSACGGRGSVSGGGGSGNSGTTPGTYTVTVTGTSGSISATVGTVTLTVQ